MKKEIFKQLNEICAAKEKKAHADKDDTASYQFFLASTLLNEKDFAQIEEKYAISLLSSLLDDEDAAKKLYRQLTDKN